MRVFAFSTSTIHFLNKGRNFGKVLLEVLKAFEISFWWSPQKLDVSGGFIGSL